LIRVTKSNLFVAAVATQALQITGTSSDIEVQ